MPVFSRFLRYFVAVAQHGSIRKASEELGIAASAIDRQLLQGENSFGAPLFERLPTGLRLTATGEMVLNAAHRWLQERETLISQIDDLKGLRRGRVDVLLPDALTKGLVPRLVGQLRQSHPGIVLNLLVRDNHDIADLLLAGAADFALILNPARIRDMEVLAQVDYPLGFVTLPDHPIAVSGAARFSASADHPMIVPAHTLALRRQIERLEHDTGVSLKAAATADSIEMIKSLVQVGAGIGILSYVDVVAEVEGGFLSFTPIVNHQLSPLVLGLCVGRARQLSAAAGLVLSLIKDSLAAAGPV